MPTATRHSELIYTIDGLLSASECKTIIAHAESLGFDEAPITTSRGPVMNKEARDNRRSMEDDPARAAWLWTKVGALAPEQEGWLPIGLNERFRYYRYDPGHYFAPHFDGAFRRENGDRSFWTFMVYLNNGFEGGETRFFDRRGEVITTITPRAGRALLFFHPQLHEGAPVRSGRKYALRSDLMYTRAQPRHP